MQFTFPKNLVFIAFVLLTHACFAQGIKGTTMHP